MVLVCENGVLLVMETHFNQAEAASDQLTSNLYMEEPNRKTLFCVFDIVLKP